MTEPEDSEPQPQFEGYFVVLRAKAHAQHLDGRVATHMPDPPAYRAWVADLRRTLGGLDPSAYAGVAREPIDRWPEPPNEEFLREWCDDVRAEHAAYLADPRRWEEARRASLPEDARRAWDEQGRPGPPDPEEFEATFRAPRPPDPDERAARLMFERLGRNPEFLWPGLDFVSGRLLPDLALAREVLALAGCPADREVIHVERATDRVLATTLGFDVGQWAGSPFSVVLDTMLFPQWHPAPDEDVPALLPFARQLNEHLLFPTAAQAQAFHDWYVAHEWAEIGTFPVIRVDGVSPP